MKDWMYLLNRIEITKQRRIFNEHERQWEHTALTTELLLALGAVVLSILGIVGVFPAYLAAIAVKDPRQGSNERVQRRFSRSFGGRVNLVVCQQFERANHGGMVRL